MATRHVRNPPRGGTHSRVPFARYKYHSPPRLTSLFPPSLSTPLRRSYLRPCHSPSTTTRPRSSPSLSPSSNPTSTSGSGSPRGRTSPSSMRPNRGWNRTGAVPLPAEPDRAAAPSPAEERRLRRMISNRESARRSRMRKKRHLEELRSRLARHRAENRELAARLAGAAHLSALLRRDSDRLRAESASLRRRLALARRVLLFRRLHLLASSPKAPL
uniref:BZIP domain-containing protein n=1 Tax=Ananas comosus var. bracteatus TaxID=296719 RepID=A0A6V7QES7_ANACO|nr:unnamed protein product [Ananas comosus var. bracteatus]